MVISDNYTIRGDYLALIRGGCDMAGSGVFPHLSVLMISDVSPFLVALGCRIRG